MEDFEYSVDICDRDWECFFAQCEECNVLPPSLAGLEDSGMSDIDDLGGVFAKRVQKTELKVGVLEEDLPVDGPPVCEGSPEELYLSKHILGGMESVLSGSEEDIHLQSVNIFFERMKSLTDTQKTTEQSQVGAIKNRAVQEDLCSDGQQASCAGCTLPRNIPKLNSVSARGEIAAGTDTAQPVSAISNTNTMKTDESGSKSAASNSVKHVYFQTESFIREETCIKKGVNKVIQPRDSLDRAVSSEVTPHADKMINLEKETFTVCDVRKEELMRNHSADCKTQSTDSLTNPDIMINGKWKEDKSTQVSQSDTDSVDKPVSKASSPCASFKRKRRKKRRLSVEPLESGLRCERPYDSEDERFTWRGAIDPFLSKDFNWSRLKEPQINYGFMPPLGAYTLSRSLPVSLAAKEIKIKDHFEPNPSCGSQHLILQDSIFTQRSSAENNGLLEVKDKLYKYNGVPVTDTERDKDQIQDKEIKETDPESVAPFNKGCSNEVKSITLAIFPSAESNDPPVDVCQSDRVSTAKSVMREETESEKLSLCQREIEPHQQLETACCGSYQSSPTAENMTPLLSETAVSTSNVTELLDHKTRHQASQCTNVVSDSTGQILDEHSQNLTNLIRNGAKQETEYNREVEDSRHNDLSLNHEITEISEAVAPRDTAASGDMSLQIDHTFPERGDLSSNATQSTCHSPVTEPVVPLSNKNIPQTLESSLLSVVQSDPECQKESSQCITTCDKMETTSQAKSLVLSHDAEEPCCELSDGEGVATTTSRDKKTTDVALNSDHTVFAMSSFWREMEKLTINDILGLRNDSKAKPSFLPPLQETDDTDFFTLSDSGCCAQAEERKLEQTSKEASIIPDPVDTNSSIAVTSDLSSSRSVQWENEPVSVSLSDSIYPDSMTLTTVSDISEPIISPGLQRISKNISVQNLRALESDPFSYNFKSQTTLKSLDEDEYNNIEYITENAVPQKDLSSLTESFKISMNDIFQYFFGEKQSDTGQSPTDNIVNSLSDGDSVPETYHHFFSEFDTDSFFYPLAQTTDEAKNELVPIFSCSRSSKRKLEFPEAYDYFFASSSDSSSSESDEEDIQERAPIRVVTRFTRKASSKEIYTDAYEHFYTDRDLRQDFFKTTFSFRNCYLTGNNIPEKTPTNALSVRIKAMPITVLGNQDLVLADPLLYHFDDQIARKLKQPLLYENLQTPVANPRLDAPLLPLKHSDMCLICIAFASWVLKTANPQAGDAWKAVLLANVSALSAIRYLRKYIKVEAAASEKKPNLKAVSNS